jgi:hypothetical protein
MLSFLLGLPARSSKALAQLFEHGNAITADNGIIKSVQSERQKEMEMLLNRWNKNKQLSSSGDSNVNVDSEIVRTVVQGAEMKQVTYHVQFVSQILAFVKGCLIYFTSCSWPAMGVFSLDIVYCLDKEDM